MDAGWQNYQIIKANWNEPLKLYRRLGIQELIILILPKYIVYTVHYEKINDLNFHTKIYGGGEAEKDFGIALKELKVPRESLVVSTKLFWG